MEKNALKSHLSFYVSYIIVTSLYSFIYEAEYAINNAYLPQTLNMFAAALMKGTLTFTRVKLTQLQKIPFAAIFFEMLRMNFL